MKRHPSAFAAPVAAALLAIPASGEVPAPPESLQLFPAEGTTVEPNDGGTVRTEGDVAVVDIAPGHDWGGVRFVFAEPFVLNAYETVSVEVSNRTDRALDFAFYGIHRGFFTWHASRRFRLGPHEGQVVTAPHPRKCYALARGSREIDGMIGYDSKNFFHSFDTSGAIDHYVVCCYSRKEPARFDVKAIRADGGRPGFTLDVDDAFFPFVDEFGQYAHADWPGKVHSLEELKAAAEAEDEALGADPVSPIPGADRFGGWGAGPQLEATGMFRTEKRNGRWWLVDPDGHLFFSLGCNYVRLQCRTPVLRRERFFSWLPARDDPPFADCWKDGKLNWLGDSLYKGAGAVPQFDFAMANQKRLYGADWKKAYVDRQHRRMRSWGFTSMGNWSDPEIMAASRTPYVDNFNLDGVRKLEGDKNGVWRKFPDVFDPDFASNVVACALKTRTPKSRTDPWCIGWFVENELHWGRGNRTDDMIDAVVGSPDDQPAKVEYLRRLRAAHGEDATFESATAEDREAFAAEIAERYFSTVKAAIGQVAPGRLYLGCRFHNSYPAALRAAAKYCDVVSFNCYKDLPEIPRFPADAVDKPTIIGEFHFGSLDRGAMHAGLVPCRDMADRAAHYKAYVRAALKDPNLVGVHWFFWCDMPLTGWMDGEDYMTGILTVTDTPHPEMVEATRELARELYAAP
ncbi:MAG: hypothetical protein II839_08285 [Kiritimatiellae bacterium]|nr:hypothetical protein [Kiritimatiellia bacterium]